MQRYWLVMLSLRFLVDLLLLMGTNRLCGYPLQLGRLVLGASLSGAYTMACMVPGFSFLGCFWWRVVSILLVALLAFGFSHCAIRRGLVYLFLSMAVGGLGTVMEQEGKLLQLISSAGVFLCCNLDIQRFLFRKHVPVELGYGGKHVRLVALRDTGNTLRDPFTGRSVLVIGADIAKIFTGLSPSQLRQPVETMGTFPGLQLIPYRSVGTQSGFLLGLHFPDVRVGNQRGSGLVAFAPVVLSEEGIYQALTGGTS